MDIMIKLFLLVYLLAVILATVSSVIYILAAIFTPEWASKRNWFSKIQKIKISGSGQRNHAHLSH